MPAPADADAFDRRIVALLAFGPMAAVIALTMVSGRGTIAMWGYPLWLFLGLWIVLAVPSAIEPARMARIVAAWATVFAIFAIAFFVNYDDASALRPSLPRGALSRQPIG